MRMTLPERFHANEAGEGRSNRMRALPTLIDSRTHDETNRHKLLTDGRNFDGKLSKSPKTSKNRFAAEKMLDRIRKLWYDYLTSLQRRFCCACILLPCLLCFGAAAECDLRERGRQTFFRSVPCGASICGKFHTGGADNARENHTCLHRVQEQKLCF